MVQARWLCHSVESCSGGFSLGKVEHVIALQQQADPWSHHWYLMYSAFLLESDSHSVLNLGRQSRRLMLQISPTTSHRQALSRQTTVALLWFRTIK